MGFLGKYEEKLKENDNLSIIETDRLPDFQSGLYINGKIFIKDSISDFKKHEVLVEELAHQKLTYGNILDQSQFNNRKFENYARRYTFEAIISLKGIITAFKQGIHNLYELANFFEVTEDFVLDCIEHYKRKYGLRTLCDDYLIEFEPLRVFEIKNIL